MPRKTPTLELLQHVETASPVRRSSRIAQNQKQPGPVTTRRASADTTPTTVKPKSRRLSLSQDTEQNSESVLRENIVRTPSTRTRKDSTSTSKEENVETPTTKRNSTPITRRRSTRSMSMSPQKIEESSDAESAIKTRIKHHPITEKLKPLESINELEVVKEIVQTIDEVEAKLCDEEVKMVNGIDKKNVKDAANFEETSLEISTLNQQQVEIQKSNESTEKTTDGIETDGTGDQKSENISNYDKKNSKEHNVLESSEMIINKSIEKKNIISNSEKDDVELKSPSQNGNAATCDVTLNNKTTAGDVSFANDQSFQFQLSISMDNNLKSPESKLTIENDKGESDSNGKSKESQQSPALNSSRSSVLRAKDLLPSPTLTEEPSKEEVITDVENNSFCEPMDVDVVENLEEHELTNGDISQIEKEETLAVDENVAGVEEKKTDKSPCEKKRRSNITQRLSQSGKSNEEIVKENPTKEEYQMDTEKQNQDQITDQTKSKFIVEEIEQETEICETEEKEEENDTICKTNEPKGIEEGNEIIKIDVEKEDITTTLKNSCVEINREEDNEEEEIVNNKDNIEQQDKTSNDVVNLETHLEENNENNTSSATDEEVKEDTQNMNKNTKRDESFKNSKNIIDRQLEDKLADLINKKFKDVHTNSDSDDVEVESVTDYLDDMAEEGDETEQSADSNEIVDEGESVGFSSSDEQESDDQSFDDSFIDDDLSDDLLSGDEYDLGDEKKIKNKEQQHQSDDPNIKQSVKKSKRKWSRIVSHQNSDEENLSLEKNEEAVVEEKNVGDDDQSESHKRELKESKQDRMSVSTEAEAEEDDEHMEVLDNVVVKSGSVGPEKKQTSMSLCENLPFSEIRNRVVQIINVLSASVPYNNKRVSLNLSLQYETGSGDDGEEKINTSLQITDVKNDKKAKRQRSASLNDLNNKYKIDGSLKKLKIGTKKGEDKDLVNNPVKETPPVNKKFNENLQIILDSPKKKKNKSHEYVQDQRSPAKNKRNSTMFDSGEIDAETCQQNLLSTTITAASNTNKNEDKNKSEDEVENNVVIENEQKLKVEEKNEDDFGKSRIRRKRKLTSNLLEEKEFSEIRSPLLKKSKQTQEKDEENVKGDKVKILSNVLISTATEAGSTVVSDKKDKRRQAKDDGTAVYSGQNGWNVEQNNSDVGDYDESAKKKKKRNKIKNRKNPSENLFLNLKPSKDNPKVWIIEDFDVSPMPSKVRKAKSILGNKSEILKIGTGTARHPKDFRNKMLYDPLRVERMDVKQLIKKKKKQFSD